ncbi:MAG: class I SAM-dependent methyltransferase [Chloroflexi bacterium]|nr:class I SAM-dependent methyltransferase [Chloroflexota bacterium]
MDIVDNGERLATIADRSQDFAVASHFIEHCQDPIGAIANMLRVLREDGVLYLIVPDMRYRLDCHRSATSNQHFLRDHREGPAWSKRQHFEEWVRTWEAEQARTDQDISARVNQLLEMDYGVHYHTWTCMSFLGFLTQLEEEMTREGGIHFEAQLLFKNESEIITILKKLS